MSLVLRVAAALVRMYGRSRPGRPKAPGVMRGTDRNLAVGDGNKGNGEACAMRTGRVRTKDTRLAYGPCIWESLNWQRMSNRRRAAVRSHSQK